MARVLLLLPTRTYRARAFLEAARRLAVEVVVGSERPQALARRTGNTSLTLDFRRPERAAGRIAQFARTYPLDAVLGVDDDSTLLAAVAAERLGLSHNPIEAVRVSRDKYATRCLLAAAGLPSPAFALRALSSDPARAAQMASYPCVLKPRHLAASRGVIRADTPEQYVTAFRRIAALLAADGASDQALLEECFLPGPEVALEGLLIDGALHLLALFDKPDPLDGPYFEETIYVTPSRLPADRQAAITEVTTRAAAALGLCEGPLHAELRLGAGGPYVLEIAARSIGGLCSSTLRFGAGVSLEELILQHALGAAPRDLEPERQAAGVMMLPIPCAGVLRAVQGRAAALRVPGVEGVAITIPRGEQVVPLPEGNRYLGFLFARGATPDQVEAALRTAHSHLAFDIASPDAPACSRSLRAEPALRLPVLRPAG